MSSHFLYRPLDFHWKGRSTQHAGVSQSDPCLSLEHYVENVMMKLPAFPRSTQPTLIVEAGYTTRDKRLNLLDEAFLGLVDSRSLIVPTHTTYLSGGVMLPGHTGLAPGQGGIVGGSRSSTPLRTGYAADVSMLGRIALPHSPTPGNNGNSNNNNSGSAGHDDASFSSSSSAPGGGGDSQLLQHTNHNMMMQLQRVRNTAILPALEHRRRMRGDETFFGMIAFSNLHRPPTDLVAPFRMSATSPSETSNAPVPAENFRLTLAMIRNDEDLLRLYDEVQSSTAFRDAASRLSIVCFVTATPPPDARHHHHAASCATTLSQLLTTGGTDVVVLLQQHHHRDAAAAFGIDTHAKLRRPEKSTVTPEVRSENEKWQAQVERNPQSNFAQKQHARQPFAAEVLRYISTAVGLRGDGVVVSRLTTASADSDILGVWDGVGAAIASPQKAAAPDSPASTESPLERHPHHHHQQQQQQDDSSTAASATGLLPGQSAHDWIIPTVNAARNELLDRQEEEARRALQQQQQQQQQLEQQQLDDLQSQSQLQPARARGAAVTSMIYATGGVPPALKTAVASEVEALEQQVAMQKQALRWFQDHAAAPTVSASMQMMPSVGPQSQSQQAQMLSHSHSQQQQQQQQQRQQQQHAPPPPQPSMNNNVSSTATPLASPAASPVRSLTRGGGGGGRNFNESAASASPSASPTLDSLQGSPQVVRSKFTRAHQESENMGANKSQWLLELDRVEVAHSNAVARRFHCARQLSERHARIDELQSETREMEASVLQSRAHVEEKSRALIGLRKQLDVSDGATKRAENQLAEVERQEMAKQRAESEDADAAAKARKHEIDAWYERAMSLQREAEVQRATNTSRHTAAIADERRRKEMLAQERTKLLQDISQAEASIRLNEVSVQETRRKIATSQTELQRARSTHHELSVTHQDIQLEQAVLNRLRLDTQHLAEQLAELETTVAAAEEQHRVNIHTSDEVQRFADTASGQGFFGLLALLRAEETSGRSLIFRDFVQVLSHRVRNFVREATAKEDAALASQLRDCRECARVSEEIAQLKAQVSANQTQRKQVAAESLQKEKQLELHLLKYERELDVGQQQRQDLQAQLEVHHTRHQGEREKTSQRLASLVQTRDAVLQEFFRQIDGETRRSVSQLASSSSSSSAKEKSALDHDDAPAVICRDVDTSSPAFAAAEYARWCDEIADIAAAQQRVHDLQERYTAAEAASVVSTDNVAESRQLLLHLEHQSEQAEAQLRALEKEVDARRAWLASRRTELESALEKTHKDVGQQTSAIEQQVRASTECVARLKKTLREERNRANGLASEIETVENGSAVALLIRELTTLRDANRARREILGAAHRVARSKSKTDTSGGVAAAMSAMTTAVRRPGDLQDNTHFPPTRGAPSERFQYGDVPPPDAIRVPFFAGEEARSPELRTVPSHGEYKSAVGRARDLLQHRATLGAAAAAAAQSPSQSAAAADGAVGSPDLVKQYAAAAAENASVSPESVRSPSL